MHFLEIASLCRQPHDCIFPDFKWQAATVVKFPQSHWQSHIVFFF